MSDNTFTQTFSDGFTVQIKDGSIGTNCEQQSQWLDPEQLGSMMRTLVQQNPWGCDTVAAFTALAAQQQRAAWLGLQELPKGDEA